MNWIKHIYYRLFRQKNPTDFLRSSLYVLERKREIIPVQDTHENFNIYCHQFLDKIEFYLNPAYLDLYCKFTNHYLAYSYNLINEVVEIGIANFEEEELKLMTANFLGLQDYFAEWMIIIPAGNIDRQIYTELHAILFKITAYLIDYTKQSIGAMQTVNNIIKKRL